MWRLVNLVQRGTALALQPAGRAQAHGHSKQSRAGPSAEAQQQQQEEEGKRKLRVDIVLNSAQLLNSSPSESLGTRLHREVLASIRRLAQDHDTFLTLSSELLHFQRNPHALTSILQALHDAARECPQGELPASAWRNLADQVALHHKPHWPLPLVTRMVSILATRCKPEGGVPESYRAAVHHCLGHALATIRAQGLQPPGQQANTTGSPNPNERVGEGSAARVPYRQQQLAVHVMLKRIADAIDILSRIPSPTLTSKLANEVVFLLSSHEKEVHGIVDRTHQESGNSRCPELQREGKGSHAVLIQKELTLQLVRGFHFSSYRDEALAVAMAPNVGSALASMLDSKKKAEGKVSQQKTVEHGPRNNRSNPHPNKKGKLIEFPTIFPLFSFLVTSPLSLACSCGNSPDRLVGDVLREVLLAVDPPLSYYRLSLLLDTVRRVPQFTDLSSSPSCSSSRRPSDLSLTRGPSRVEGVVHVLMALYQATLETAKRYQGRVAEELPHQKLLQLFFSLFRVSVPTSATSLEQKNLPSTADRNDGSTDGLLLQQFSKLQGPTMYHVLKLMKTMFFPANAKGCSAADQSAAWRCSWDLLPEGQHSKFVRHLCTLDPSSATLHRLTQEETNLSSSDGDGDEPGVLVARRTWCSYFVSTLLTRWTYATGSIHEKGRVLDQAAQQEKVTGLCRVLDALSPLDLHTALVVRRWLVSQTPFAKGFPLVRKVYVLGLISKSYRGAKIDIDKGVFHCSKPFAMGLLSMALKARELPIADLVYFFISIRRLLFHGVPPPTPTPDNDDSNVLLLPIHEHRDEILDLVLNVIRQRTNPNEWELLPKKLQEDLVRTLVRVESLEGDVEGVLRAPTIQMVEALSNERHYLQRQESPRSSPSSSHHLTGSHRVPQSETLEVTPLTINKGALKSSGTTAADEQLARQEVEKGEGYPPQGDEDDEEDELDDLKEWEMRQKEEELM